jgi:prophage antirepressor-like protein
MQKKLPCKGGRRVGNELQIFSNEQFGLIRAITKDTVPWFVGIDVTKVLGYQNGSRDINRHVDEDDRAEFSIWDGSQNRNMTVINESGLYSLVLGSKLAEAKKFKKWVTSEVLPDIRKHKMYATEELLDNPDLLIAAATRLKEERAARLAAESKVQALTPKAAFYDDVAGSKDAIEMGHVAKVLAIKGFGRNNLFDFLRDKGVLDRNNIPYQRFIDSGHFRTIEQKYNTGKGEVKINIKTLVFQKGVDYIRKLIKEAN